MIQIPKSWLKHTKEPDNAAEYTNKMDKIYTRFAKAYDGFMKVFPLWKRWLESVLPYVNGKRVLEVSFGPAYLMGQLSDDLIIHGLDYNKTMVYRARFKMKQLGKRAKIIRGNVEQMPYPDGVFQTVINTMAFSGYPNGRKAMEEMLRVLKPEGELLILDYDYPQDRNIGGFLLVKLIEASGDIIRDIEGIANECNCRVKRSEIGGFGAVQLFRISKNGL